MHVAVMGAGAVGGYFGARLATAGARVTFVARGEHLAAMQSRGLQIKSAQGDLEIRASFVSRPDGADPADLILFAVKSHDTEEAARSLGPFVGGDTAIVSLQNGVDNADRIARLWGRDRTLAGVAYVAARVMAPGVIEHGSRGRIVLGPLHAGGQAHARAAQSALVGAKIAADLSPNIQEALWTKLGWSAPFCALSCLLRMTVGDIVGSASLAPLVRGCVDEVLDAARSRGIDLPAATADEVVASSRTLRNVKTSMLQDLEAGKPLEHEALNGIVVRTLQQAGKRAPINEIFYSALGYIDRDLRAGRGGAPGSSTGEGAGAR
ncbi:MAG TPA: 2-dehydropantoate 2-reductase [Candidatus Bathyarchaeia archaeon]|nr:2-dehydropantoate 2-reductase [Candidatus Bathyarchaeia archaeon]